MSDPTERVVQIIAELLGRAPADVALAARFTEDLEADSLEVAEIVMALEEAFDVQIPDDAPESIHTVGDAVEVIRKQLG
jgi:acyl carrier protein